MAGAAETAAAMALAAARRHRSSHHATAVVPVPLGKPRSLDPRIWGGDLWSSLHRIALYYPDTPTDADQEACTSLFRGLCRMLPCEQCCQHYARYFYDTFVSSHASSSRTALTVWLFRLHEQVNARKGYPGFYHPREPQTDTCTCEADARRIVRDVNTHYSAFPARFLDVSGHPLEQPRYRAVQQPLPVAEVERDATALRAHERMRRIGFDTGALEA